MKQTLLLSILSQRLLIIFFKVTVSGIKTLFAYFFERHATAVGHVQFSTQFAFGCCSTLRSFVIYFLRLSVSPSARCLPGQKTNQFVCRWDSFWHLSYALSVCVSVSHACVCHSPPFMFIFNHVRVPISPLSLFTFCFSKCEQSCHNFGVCYLILIYSGSVSIYILLTGFLPLSVSWSLLQLMSILSCDRFYSVCVNLFTNRFPCTSNCYVFKVSHSRPLFSLFSSF